MLKPLTHREELRQKWLLDNMDAIKVPEYPE